MSRFAKVAAAASALGAAQAFVVPGASAPGAPSFEPTAAAAQQWSAPDVEETPRSWSPLAFGAALGLLSAVVVGRAPAALAADLENGESVFLANCAACHANGNNSIVAEKKLKKEALQQYGRYEVEAIIKQATNGYGAMPAFGERLAPDDIEDVANYVRAQADKGW